MNTFFSKFFSHASNARRAARAAGIPFSGVRQDAQGWQVVPATDPVLELGGAAAPDSLPEPVAATEPLVTGVAFRHKEFATYVPSTVEKPVARVHAFCRANPTLGRKETIRQLVEQGVNYCTARTQYQVWFRQGR